MANTYATEANAGRSSAFLVYCLYLLSIPSFGLFALAGVILAIMSRDGAAPLPRAHMREQIAVWWTAFWWAVGLAVLTLIGWALTIVLIGFPLLFLAWVGGGIIAIWFTVKSFLGLWALLDNRTP